MGPGLGTTHVLRTQTIEPVADKASAPAFVPPEPARQLLAASDDLDTAPPEPHNAALVRGLHALADALDLVAPHHPAEILRLRQTTDELEDAHLRPGSHASLVRIAFDAAARALAGVSAPRPCDRDRLSASVDALRAATKDVDPHLPLTAQYVQLRAALRASVRAVFAATGSPEPTIAMAPATH